jgi:hypothetical protein
VFVVVAVVYGVAVAVVDIVDMVAVRNRYMSASFAVDVIMSVGGVAGGLALVVVIVVGAMQVAVVHVVDVVFVGDGDVAATGAVGVVVAFVLGMNRCSHRLPRPSLSSSLLSIVTSLCAHLPACAEELLRSENVANALDCLHLCRRPNGGFSLRCRRSFRSPPIG